MVLLWLAAGMTVLALVPAARGSAQFGATLPFWLVVAPLLDLAWLNRRRLAGLARPRWRRPGSLRQAKRWRREAGIRIPRRRS